MVYGCIVVGRCIGYVDGLWCRSGMWVLVCYVGYEFIYFEIVIEKYLWV